MSLKSKRVLIIQHLTLLVMMLFTVSAEATSTTITSLPYIASQQGTNYSETLYVAGTKLISTDNGIDIRGHDIVLFLAADTITFGAGNGNDNWGIRFYGSGNNDGSSMTACRIKIIGGTILHAATNDTPSGNVGIVFSGGSNIYFQNTNVVVRGANGHCLKRPSSSWGIWNVEYNGGRWTSNVVAYTSRCQYDGAAAMLSNSLQSLSGNDYHFKIHDVVMTKSPGQGLVIQGLTYVYDCSLTVDARNDFYTYPSGGVCNSSANSFAIIAQLLEAGSSVHDNVIRAGDQYLGCDGGIILQLSKGTAEKPVEIYDNDILLHRGHDQYYYDLNSKAFKSRYANKHAHIHDNRFIVQVGNSSQSAYGVNGTAVDVVSYWDMDCDWAAGRYPDSFLVYENNYIEVLALDGSFNGGTCARFAITDNDGYTWEGAGNIWRNNHLKSAEVVYQIGGYDNDGMCNQMLILGDIIEYGPDIYGFNQYAFNVGYDLNSIGNKARDCSFINGAQETDIHFTYGSGERTLALQRTLRILVLGNNDCPVAGATVTVKNNYNRTVLNTTTDQYGIASGVVTYRYEAEDGPDSTNFNDFTITASKSGENKISSLTVNSTHAADTLKFDGVAGDCDVDITPPATINDLNVIPGDSNGEIELSWTAPGDDGNIGIADHYEIRYSFNQLTDINWEEATLWVSPPTPASPGSNQGCIISDLTGGEGYYLGIITYDENGLPSELSNVVESFAAGIAIPVPMSTAIDSVNNSVTVTAIIVESYHPLYYVFELDSIESFTSPELNLDRAADTLAEVTFSNLSDDINYSGGFAPSPLAERIQAVGHPRLNLA